MTSLSYRRSTAKATPVLLIDGEPIAEDATVTILAPVLAEIMEASAYVGRLGAAKAIEAAWPAMFLSLDDVAPPTADDEVAGLIVELREAALRPRVQRVKRDEEGRIIEIVSTVEDR